MGQVPAVQPHHALVYPLDADTVLAISKAYAAQAARNAQCFGLPPFVHPRTLAGDGRLRIGYVRVSMVLVLSVCVSVYPCLTFPV